MPPLYLTTVLGLLCNFCHARSAIFYHSDEQRRAAEEVVAAVQPKFPRQIVTEVTAASTW